MERSVFFDTKSAKEYFEQYSKKVAETFEIVARQGLEDICEVLIESRRVFVAGNGGSLATAEHFVCDMGKGAGLCVVPLTCAPVLTAYANDVSYTDVFVEQLRLHEPFTVEDTLVLLSASGNSPNVCKAAQYAMSSPLTVIGLTGFTGGTLQGLVDFGVHVPVHNYGIVEDVHSMLMHAWAQYLSHRCP